MIYLTYTHSRRFGGYNIPITIQTCYIRDYCKKNAIAFRIPRTEYCIGGCYSSLINMIAKRKLDKNVTVIMCSVYMLEEAKDLAEELQDLLSDQDIVYDCILEGLRMNYQEVRRYLTECNKFNKLALGGQI